MPVTFVAFDLLHLSGRSLLGDPYQQRRVLLEALGLETRSVAVPPSFTGEIRPVADASRSLGMEGVMLKRLGSPYSPGRRSRDWLKIKAHGRLGEYPAAAAAFDQALELYYALGDVASAADTCTYKIGYLYEPAGMPEDALRAYDQAIGMLPGDPSLHFNKGGLLFDLGRLDEAVPCLTEVIRLRPGDVLGARVLLGAIAWPDDQDQAREHFAAALSSPGTLLVPLTRAVYRAIALTGIGRFDEARHELQLALPGRSADNADTDGHTTFLPLLHRLQDPPLPGLDTLQMLLGPPDDH